MCFVFYRVVIISNVIIVLKSNMSMSTLSSDACGASGNSNVCSAKSSNEINADNKAFVNKAASDPMKSQVNLEYRYHELIWKDSKRVNSKNYKKGGIKNMPYQCQICGKVLA